MSSPRKPLSILPEPFENTSDSEDELQFTMDGIISKSNLKKNVEVNRDDNGLNQKNDTNEGNVDSSENELQFMMDGINLKDLKNNIEDNDDNKIKPRFNLTRSQDITIYGNRKKIAEDDETQLSLDEKVFIKKPSSFQIGTANSLFEEKRRNLKKYNIEGLKRDDQKKQITLSSTPAPWKKV